MQKRAVCVCTCKMSLVDDKCTRETLWLRIKERGRNETHIIWSHWVAGTDTIISNGVLKPFSPLSPNGSLIPFKHGRPRLREITIVLTARPLSIRYEQRWPKPSLVLHSYIREMLGWKLDVYLLCCDCVHRIFLFPSPDNGARCSVVGWSTMLQNG
jgi:hypothetical protein